MLVLVGKEIGQNRECGRVGDAPAHACGEQAHHHKVVDVDIGDSEDGCDGEDEKARKHNLFLVHAIAHDSGYQPKWQSDEGGTGYAKVDQRGG